MQERQLHRLLVVQAEDRRGLQRDDANRHRFGEGPDHHPELFAALDHAEKRLGAAQVDPHGLEPPAEDEADGGEHDVRLVDDAAGGVVVDEPPINPPNSLRSLLSEWWQAFEGGDNGLGYRVRPSGQQVPKSLP